MDIDRIIGQVKHNCDVSDAHHAGIYSICGLAMRLRDLYKWDRRLSPWQEHEAKTVLEWIGQREDLWESLADDDYWPLTLDGKEVDPFDTEQINAVLTPHGHFYGAGYAHSLKPTFFLARIDARFELDGKTVWQLGRELARDLLTLPAFTQDGQVVLRREAALMFLWDQMAYISNSGREALAFALAACCNLPDTDLKGIRRHLEAIFQIQQMTYIRHELGEMDEQEFDAATWRRMLADFPHTAVELLIRTLKDVLADTGPQGPLNHFIAEHHQAGLGFYIAFSSGLVPALFGELKSGFDRFLKTDDWNVVRSAVEQVHRKAADYSREVVALYAAGQRKNDLPWARNAIEETLHAKGVHTKED